ncbi:MAG: hypothetical protein ACRDK8_07185, partial [Solirubrobacteraceae bacterium]
VFERIADDPRVRYFGNVELGRHLSRHDLLAHYHAVIYAIGAPGDHELSLPGQELPGCIAAGALVGWYNGHPDHRDINVDLSTPRAVVIGNGNVALDVARILTRTPEQLARTDIAEHALVTLARSRIEEVLVLGRRGPEQAAFTHAQLHRLAMLHDTDVVVDDGEVTVPAALREHRPGMAAQRNLALLQELAARPPGRRRRIALRFLLSPTRITGQQHVEAIELVRNHLSRETSGSLRAHPTNARTTVPAGLVVSAIGHRGVPVAGLPFDPHRHAIASHDGRIAMPNAGFTPEYVVGWAKRGPTGVVGTNKKCARDTVRALTQDLLAGRLTPPARDPSSIPALLRHRQAAPFTYDDWVALDHHERSTGQRVGAPRVKLTRVSDLLELRHAA